jgi:glycosyltransferase A (GT-A) superfamily protein (DUF2064 family)
MVKEPRPGKAKTRLGRDIGMLEAAQWYKRHSTQMLRDLVDPRWTNVAALTPRTARITPGQATFVVDQGEGHLGRRMMRMLRMAPPRSVLIGSDILGVTPSIIWGAMQRLAEDDAVIGPADDGGYWLIGFKSPARLSPFLLDGVRWSSPNALQDTIDRLPGRVGFVQTLRDVDRGDDLP